MNIGALHQITGRQWVVDDDASNAIWPDACLVVPFGTRVSDDTNKIINPVDGTSVQGGWTVKGTLQQLDLTDLVAGTKVPGVTAVWAAGPGGDTPALHVLGDDPLSWLTPHLDAAATSTTSFFPLKDQWFGNGPAEKFSSPRRFGELVVTPASGQFGQLEAAPLSWVKSRALQAPGAQLSFSFPSGEPIVIDQLLLGVLVPAHKKESLLALPNGWSIAMFSVNVGAGIDSISIPYPSSILWARYRHRALTVTTPQRITLQPGHYELMLSGTTTGVAPSGFRNAVPVTWSATRRFWVAHPPSLRPYITFSTIGDDRLFGPEPGFNPTLAGVGFPVHMDYLPAVRFCVPYIKSMFPELRLRMDYVNGPDVVEDVTVVANPDGGSSLPETAVDWKLTHGGTVLPDDEVTMGGSLVPGPGALRLCFVPPTGPEFELDSWGVHVSRFETAALHLAWPGDSILHMYRQDGPHNLSPCSTLVKPSWQAEVVDFQKNTLKELQDVPKRAFAAAKELVRHNQFGESIAGRLLIPGEVFAATNPPEEYTTPPGDWLLPEPLASLAGPLDIASAQRFLLFFQRSGVRLVGDAAAPAFSGLGKPASATTIEAVCDDEDRPLALWLRTPEPLDWRRVNIGMTLRHVSPDTGCPKSYPNRPTMELTCSLLPSIDGSSALLVGRYGGDVPIRLPRGEITLKIRYAVATPGLVALRRRPPTPSNDETLNLTFLQSWGRPWPLKPGSPKFPGIGKIPEKRVKPEFGPGPGPIKWDPLSELVQILIAEGVKTK